MLKSYAIILVFLKITTMSNFLSLRSYTSETCRHSHEFTQLVLPIKGSLELEVDGQAGYVDAQKGACIHANMEHCFNSGHDNLFLVVDFPETHCHLNTQDLSPFLDLNPEIQTYIAFAHSYLAKQQNLMMDNLLFQTLIQLLPSKTLQDNSVILAKQWLDKNFANPINITQLAQYCHLSSSQLQRRFKRITGCSLAEYWRMKKLEYAKILLGQTSLSIEDIAYKIGYENLPAFSRRFNQSYGLSPSQWRNMLQTAKNMHVKDNK